MIRSVLRASGAYLPENVVSNDKLAETVDTSDAWITERTGIKQRHFADPSQVTSDLATEAAKQALERAGASASSIDLLIVATSTTADNTFPATATAVLRKLGAGVIPAFDLQAVCAGFPYGLATADAYIRSGQMRRVMVIGAETFSRILDWQDRSTCVLFGDGAGAFLLDAEKVADEPKGLLATDIKADGRHYHDLYVDGGPSQKEHAHQVGYVRMNGREVFRHAVGNLSRVALGVLEKAGMSIEDVDWLVPHQANQRIIDGVGKKLGIGRDRVISTVAHHANTSAASIPLAFETGLAEGKIQKGQLILMNAIGGGFAWGGALLRY